MVAKVIPKSASGLTKIANIYQEAGIDPDKQRLYLNKSGDIDIPLLPDEYIVLHGNEDIISGKIDAGIEANPSVGKPVKFEFNDKKEAREKAKVTSEELCSLDGELGNALLFADLNSTVDARVRTGITLVIQDGDHYFTIPADDEDENVVDLEQCSKTNRRPPRGQKAYRLKIDGKKYKVEQQRITGTEILQLVRKSYDNWTLNQKLRGGRRRPVEADQIVDLAEPGVERFETVQKQAQQGWYVGITTLGRR